MARVASCTAHVASEISDKLKVPIETVREVIEMYFESIVRCMEEEHPFTVTRFGKFFFTYQKPAITKKFMEASFFNDKVRRKINFKVTDQVKKRVDGWVHDLGMRSNLNKAELVKLKIKPEEIAKTRRAKVLAEQRAVGFRPELLFDDRDIPQADREVMQDLGNAPTLQEMIDKLGFNLDVER